MATPPPIPPKLPPVPPAVPPIQKPAPVAPMPIEQLKEIERKRKEEEQRKEQERREEEARKKAARKAWWKKFGILVFLGIAAAIAVPLYFFFTSDSWHFKKGMEAFGSKDYKAAIEHLSEVEDTKSLKYIEAQYHLYEIYLEQGDSTSACKALKNAVINNKWENCTPAYKTYAGYLCSGEMEPHISKNLKEGADLYLKSQDPEVRINAVMPYFECGRYDDAIMAFNENVDLVYYHDNGIGDAYLRMGTIYRYGLGCAEVDVQMAKEYYERGSGIVGYKLPFVAELADMYVLFSGYSGSYCEIDYIRRASNLYLTAYGLAEKDDPFRQFYYDCHDITNNFLKAREATDKNWYEIDWDHHWSHYRFKSNGESIGYYTGVVHEGNMGEQNPNGWGMFYWNKDQVRISKYDTNCNASGIGLTVRADGTSTVGKTYGRNGYITEGLDNKGKIKEVGTFDKRTLKKGKTYNIY